MAPAKKDLQSTASNAGPVAIMEIKVLFPDGTRRSSDEETRTFDNIHRYASTCLWGAYVREPWVGGTRHYCGSHFTRELAVRCQDRAMIKYVGDPNATKTINLTYPPSHYEEDQEMREILSHEEWRELLRQESRLTYSRLEATPCLRKFWDEEGGYTVLAAGRDSGVKKEQKIVPLQEYVEKVLRKREELASATHSRSWEVPHIPKRKRSKRHNVHACCLAMIELHAREEPQIVTLLMCDDPVVNAAAMTLLAMRSSGFNGNFSTTVQDAL